MEREWLTAADAAARVLSALEGGEGPTPVAVVTAVKSPDADAIGRRLVVTNDSVAGSLGALDVDELAIAAAREALEAGEPELRTIEVAGDAWDLFIEPQRAAPELLIIGAGHIARPLCALGKMLGFRVTVIDDRPEYVDRAWFPDADRLEVIDFSDPFGSVSVPAGGHIVLVTRGHKYDYDCIRELLERDVPLAYLGMIGSRRRVRAAFEALVADGVAPERLQAVHAPIGLDIGAETPEEIALAIAAEIVAVRRGGSGGMLAAEEKVLRRVKGGRERQARDSNQA